MGDVYVISARPGAGRGRRGGAEGSGGGCWTSECGQPGWAWKRRRAPRALSSLKGLGAGLSDGWSQGGRTLALGSVGCGARAVQFRAGLGPDAPSRERAI
jgi:hypothetical protein